MIYNRTVVTITAFLSLAFNGLTFTFVGTSLPVIRSYLDISIGQAGNLMAMMQVGFTLFSLIAGILSDRFRCERILMSGCILLALSSFFLCASPLLGLNIMVSFSMGAGLGCILSGSNSLLIRLYPGRRGPMLNIHHVFFGLGSLAGPLLMGLLIAHDMKWRIGYQVEAGILLLLAATLFFSGGEYPRPVSRRSMKSHLGKLLHDRQFRVILGLNCLTTGSQVALLLLGVTFLIETKGYSLTLAGIALSLYSVAMIIGRLVCSKVLPGVSHASVILTLIWMQVICLFVTWYSTGWVSFCAIVMSGLTISGIYPTSLALSGIFYPQVAGSALGLLSTVSGFGSIFICWLTAYIGGLTDMHMGFTVIVLACLSGLFFFQFNYRAIQSRENSLQSESRSPQ